MCCKSNNSCPANKKKNADKVAQAHKDGRIPNNFGNKQGWAKGLTKDSDPRVAKASATLQARIASGEYVPKGTPHTEEMKMHLSEKRSEWLRIPENRKNYGRGKKSWMELCFEKWMADNNIVGWSDEEHFWNPIAKKNYFADYVFTEKKLIIELDGTQHRKTVEQDRIRDEYLQSLGYTVIRVPHTEFKERYFSSKGFNDLLRL